MKLKMYSIYDKQACFYSPPFFAKTDAEAIRIVHDATIYGQESMLRNHPADFMLCGIGTFDDALGSFDPYSQPTVLLGNFIFKEVLDDGADLQ